MLKKENKGFEYYRSKFQEAYAQYNCNLFDQYELLYRGTKNVDKNVNDTSKNGTKKANNVRNIVFELIETQVNTEIPDPTVIALERGLEDQAKMIKGKIMSDIGIMDLETLADTVERDAPMMGLTGALMGWDLKGGTHNQMGEKTLSKKHPKQIIPQPGVYNIDDMDMVFLMGATTKNEIWLKYEKDVSDASEEYPEINEIETDTNKQDSNENVTEIVCYYKDEETGDIGKLVWVLDILLEDYPKYFYPRIMVCPSCEKEYSQGTEECECGETLNETLREYDVIDEDLELDPLSYEKKVKSVVVNDDGKKEVTEDVETVIMERKIKKGTKVKFPAPKRFPIAIRINTPLNFSFAGQSDVQVIRSQQEEVKKALSKASEKIFSSGTIIEKPTSIKQKLTNETMQVIEIDMKKDEGSIKVTDMQPSVEQEVNFSNSMYDQAKSTLGITDSFQGKSDTTAQSGRAKQVQVQQAAGRLQSKIKNKYKFYSRIFELMFEFDLAFSQEERAYMTRDKQNKVQYEVWDKHNLLMEDDAGEWYYCTDFHFGADETASMPSREEFVLEQSPAFVEAGLLTPKQFWQVMTSVNFPFASNILSQIEDDTPDEMTDVLSVLSQLDPNQLAQFMQLPVEQQVEYFKKLDAPQEG